MVAQEEMSSGCNRGLKEKFLYQKSKALEGAAQLIESLSLGIFKTCYTKEHGFVVDLVVLGLDFRILKVCFNWNNSVIHHV